MPSDEYYRLFGLKRNASSKDIKIIYRKLVKRFHPDSLEIGTSPEEIRSAEEYFKRIHEAYEVIYSDALERETKGGNREREELEEVERIQRKKEYDRGRVEHKEKSSGGKWFFGLIIILAVMALGWYGTQDSSNSAISTPQKTTPSVTTTPTEKATPSSASVVTSSADQKTITNSIGMEFVQIPAGKFDMGSPANEKDRTRYEAVQSVNISNAFYMGKYEVTQKQWRDVMGTNPSNWKGDNLPVEKVSWDDIHDFINKLNVKEGVNKYRLPSEAEWEYAARAGTTTRYSFGDDESILGEYAWYDANSGSKTHDVGQKKPNSWGLYDMHGNVWEWVQDNWYDEGNEWRILGKVFRGGGWRGYAGYCRSAVKRYAMSGDHYYDIGFRLMIGPGGWELS